MISLYVIYDTTAGEASMPFDAKNDEVAKRRFEDTVNRQIRGVETVKPEEYELRCIGNFDSEKCVLTSQDYTVVCNGSQVDFWPEEVMAKYRQPTFDMDFIKKKMEQMSKSDHMTKSLPYPKTKKKHFWQK